MRIFCLADTQDNPNRLNKYLKIAQPLLKEADLIAHLGDGISKAKPLLTGYSNIIYVRGNHDSTEDAPEYELSVFGKKFPFVHGEGNPWREQPNIWLNKFRNRLDLPPLLDSYYARLYKRYKEKCDVLIYGHIHIPKLEKVQNTTFFCPGGLPPERLLFGTPPAVGEMIIKGNGNQLINTFKTYALDIKKKEPELLWQKKQLLKVNDRS